MGGKNLQLAVGSLSAGQAGRQKGVDFVPFLKILL